MSKSRRLLIILSGIVGSLLAALIIFIIANRVPKDDWDIILEIPRHTIDQVTVKLRNDSFYDSGNEIILARSREGFRITEPFEWRARTESGVYQFLNMFGRLQSESRLQPKDEVRSQVGLDIPVSEFTITWDSNREAPKETIYGDTLNEAREPVMVTTTIRIGYVEETNQHFAEISGYTDESVNQSWHAIHENYVKPLLMPLNRFRSRRILDLQAENIRRLSIDQGLPQAEIRDWLKDGRTWTLPGTGGDEVSASAVRAAPFSVVNLSAREFFDRIPRAGLSEFGLDEPDLVLTLELDEPSGVGFRELTLAFRPVPDEPGVDYFVVEPWLTAEPGTLTVYQTNTEGMRRQLQQPLSSYQKGETE